MHLCVTHATEYRTWANKEGGKERKKEALRGRYTICVERPNDDDEKPLRRLQTWSWPWKGTMGIITHGA